MWFDVCFWRHNKLLFIGGKCVCKKSNYGNAKRNNHFSISDTVPMNGIVFLEFALCCRTLKNGVRQCINGILKFFFLYTNRERYKRETIFIFRGIFAYTACTRCRKLSFSPDVLFRYWTLRRLAAGAFDQIGKKSFSDSLLIEIYRT